MNLNVCKTGRLCLLFGAICFNSHVLAQETIKMGISGCEKMFLEKNLSLLAASLNVSAQKAMEIQARLYPNPILAGEINAIDPQNGKFLNAGKTGQKALSAEQVILLGGKRKNEIEIARQNTQMAQLELEDLLRNLKLQLHTSFYSVYFDELTLNKYNTQLELLDTIITNYELQAKKGNISLKEIVRLKSVYLGLNNDKTELLQNIEQEQKNLRILLGAVGYISPEIEDSEWDKFERLPVVDSLLYLAELNRPDRKLAEMNKELASLNLRLQKSMAVPDVAVGGAYDQAGGAFRNQVNLTLGIPLPLWHRNQGNIKAAKAQIEIAAINQEISTNEIKAEVTTAWVNMQRGMTEYAKSRQVYNADFTEVFTGITDNFRKRNISIIEFVDFFESYNESIASVNRIRKHLSLCAATVDFVTNSAIY
jgi:outer membrane protein, heavy metal efflux system